MTGSKAAIVFCIRCQPKLAVMRARSTAESAREVTTFSQSIVSHSPNMEGLKMDSGRVDLGTGVVVDSLVNYLRECNLRQRRDLRTSKGTEGSNPSLSATQSVMQRNPPGFL